MRISKGLENIHSVIDRHEAEWRKEQGEISEVDEALSLEESVRRRLTAPSNPEGRFSPDRFLGASQKSKNDNSDGDEKKVEIVSVIKSQDNNKQHSWLYNEVVKAINDAADDKNIKVVAVFVPVIQNSKEFEDLPVDRIVNLPPVSEDEISISAEELEQEQTQETNEDFNLLPETQIESDEELAEAFQTMEEKLDDSLQKENEENEEAVESESVEEVENVESVEPSEPIEQEEFAVIQEIKEPEEPEAVEEIEVEEVESEGQPEILQHEEIEITSESPEVLEEISNETPDEEKKEDENIIVPPPLDDLDDDEVFDDSQFELSEDLDLQNENEEDKQPTLEDIGDFIN